MAAYSLQWSSLYSKGPKTADEDKDMDTPGAVFLHEKLTRRQIDRFIICLGLALINLGFRVGIWTTQFNEGRCVEVVDFRSIIYLKVYGNWIPSTIFGYFKRPMSYFRTIFLTLKFIFVTMIKTPPHLRPKIVLHDLNSTVSILLKLFTRCKVFYIRDFPYHNLPMLSNEYNGPTMLEACTINWADRVIVQRLEFAHRIQLHNYPICWPPKVLHEAVDIGLFKKTRGAPLEDIHIDLNPKQYILLSIGKYTYSTDFKLIIDSFFEFLEMMRGKMNLSRFKLIIAGYTSLHEENKYFREIQRYVYKKFKISNCIIFIRILPVAYQKTLLKLAKITIHPSTRDVSAEFLFKSMYMGKTIVGTNTGLASRLLTHRVTGIMTKPKPKNFAKVYCEIVQSPHLLRFLQSTVKQLFEEEYSFTALTKKTEQMLEDHKVEVNPLELDVEQSDNDQRGDRI